MTETLQDIWDILNEFELVFLVLIGLLVGIGARIWIWVKRKKQEKRGSS